MSYVEDSEFLGTDALRNAMNRAARLATNGPQTTNPRVGCVITDGRHILSEGWHRGVGTPHAEVDALSNLSVSAEGLTAVVTLEPCNHHGHTGPCTQALRDAGITRVIYGAYDPFEGSGGAQALQNAGFKVQYLPTRSTQNLLTCWQALKRNRPVVTIKWAQSLDGRIAAPDGTSQWITSPAARDDVHQRRAQYDAIAVGTGTVLADNPTLTARSESGELLLPAPDQPQPVVFGHRPIPSTAALNAHPRAAPIQLTGENLRADLAELLTHGITSVFVEGGPTLISALLTEGVVDDVLVYTAPLILGGPHTATHFIGVETLTQGRRLDVIQRRNLGCDQLTHAYIIDHPHQEESYVYRAH